jgi:hypothetical protein
VNSAFDYVSSNSGEPTRAIGGCHSGAVVRVEVDVKNQVQLITYVDRRAGNFKLLKSLLTSSLEECTCFHSSLRLMEQMRASIQQTTPKLIHAWGIGATYAD